MASNDKWNVITINIRVKTHKRFVYLKKSTGFTYDELLNVLMPKEIPHTKERVNGKEGIKIKI